MVRRGDERIKPKNVYTFGFIGATLLGLENFIFLAKMQKTLLSLDQLQNYLIRGFSILITLIIYGLGSIRANHKHIYKINQIHY